MEHKRCPHTCRGGVSVGLGLPAVEVPVCLGTAQSQLLPLAGKTLKSKSLCPYAHWHRHSIAHLYAECS